MARFLPRTIRNMLVCASAIGALLTQVPAQAADVSLWKDIQKAGVLRCGAGCRALRHARCAFRRIQRLFRGPVP
jgi:polar amino acid transport system substrate-binding protein